MSTSRFFIGALLVIIGISAFTGIDFVKFFIAILFIFWGIKILSNRKHFHNVSKNDNDETVTKSETSSLNEVWIFSPVNKKIVSKTFEGGKIVMVFAGGKIDFTGVKTKTTSINLEIVNVFGGTKIVIPEGWRINSDNISLIGGIDDRTNTTQKNAGITLNLKAINIFGGIEAVN
jgi:predicted membrane protein